MGFCVYNFCALVTLILVFRAKNKRMERGEYVEGAPEGFRFGL
jgi:hypothetical protein